MKTIKDIVSEPKPTNASPKELIKGLFAYKQYVAGRAASNKEPMWVKHSAAVNQFVKMAYGFYLTDQHGKKE